jgi:hypothetical protein
MIIDCSKPVWDPRFAELDTLIAESNRRKNRVLTGAEQTEAHIEHIALLKRQTAQRALARRALRVVNVRS